MNAVVPLPLRDEERAELVRLRAEVDEVERPVMEMVRELVRLRHLRDVAEHDMAKVAEHERCGYGHIRTSAFAATRSALEALK